MAFPAEPGHHPDNQAQSARDNPRANPLRLLDISNNLGSPQTIPSSPLPPLTQSPSTGSITLVDTRHIVPLQDIFSNHYATPRSVSDSSPYPSSRSPCIRLSTRASEQLRISMDSYATDSEMDDSHVEDSELSVNSLLGPDKDQTDSRNQNREEGSQQYHEIPNPDYPTSLLPEGSSTEYMSGAEISKRIPSMPFTLTEEGLEELISGLEISSASSDSNEPVHHCTQTVRHGNIFESLRNSIQNPFDTKDRPLEEYTAEDANILRVCANEGFYEEISATPNDNNGCDQAVIEQTMSRESLSLSRLIAKTRERKKLELDLNDDPMQQVVADVIDRKQERTLVLLDRNYQRLRRKFRSASFDKRCQVINRLRAIMEELEAELLKGSEVTVID